MNKYVLIFAFNEDDHVLMIRKSKRPEHHIGLLNGLGGKIEEGETAGVAAIREFSEETGISEEEIVLMGTFGEMSGPSWDVTMMWMKANFDSFFSLNTEEGKVDAYDPADCLTWKAVPNIQWLVPMAFEAMYNEDFDKSKITYHN